MDRGAWWAAGHGVAKSQTWLNGLSIAHARTEEKTESPAEQTLYNSVLPTPEPGKKRRQGPKGPCSRPGSWWPGMLG